MTAPVLSEKRVARAGKISLKIFFPAGENLSADGARVFPLRLGAFA
jgi:hypothetical protein